MPALPSHGRCEDQGRCQRSIPLPAFWPLQGQAETSRGVPVRPQEGRVWGVGPGTPSAAACSALPHLREEREMHLDSRPGPCPASPAGRLLCTASSLDPAPVGLHPRQGWRASWPQPPRGLRKAGAARQGAQKSLGSLGALALSVWPGLRLPDRALLVQLSGSACLHLCLNLEPSVSLCLAVSLLWACLEVTFCPSSSLLGA